ncbi:MAG: glycosyltransferase family 39 protein [Candidatus Eisenbacteria bacterium]|nr:glycosyltransferase family 39 protein [Candidatus Eisenbacteria bacterium]
MSARRERGVRRTGGGGAWIDAGALLLVALAARVAYGLSLRGDILFDHPQVDARLFWEGARAILAGAGGEAVYYKPPLIIWLLAAMARLFGAEGAGGARMAFLILSSLAAPMTALLVRPALGRGRAVAAGIFVALYAPAVFYGGELLPASVVLLLNLGALLLLARAEERGGALLYGAAGLLIGLSALARPTILLFPLLLLVRYRRARRSAAALAAGVIVGILPATIHNAVGGDFVLVSSNGGVNFYLGNHAGADGRSALAQQLPNEPGEAERAARAIAEREAGGPLRPSRVSRYWLGEGLRWIAADPGGALALTLRRAYYLVNDAEISDNIDPAAVAETSLPLRILPFGFGILFALGLAGFGTLRRTRRGRLLLLYALAVLLPPLFFFVVGRFRLPLLPVLAAAAAAGLFRFAGDLRAHRRGAAIGAALIGAGLLLSMSGFLGVRADRSWHLHYLRGDALYRMGRVEEATAAFEESFRRNEGVPLTRNALGYLYAERGIRLDRAVNLIRGAIGLEPGRRRFYLDSLGWALFRKGEMEEAAEAFEEAIPLFGRGEEGSRAETLGHLAEVRLAQGRGAEADSLRKEAARLTGGGGDR